MLAAAQHQNAHAEQTTALPKGFERQVRRAGFHQNTGAEQTKTLRVTERAIGVDATAEVVQCAGAEAARALSSNVRQRNGTVITAYRGSTTGTV